MADLSRLPKLPPGGNDPVAAIAVMALDVFAANVAAALNAPGAATQARRPHPPATSGPSRRGFTGFAPLPSTMS